MNLETLGTEGLQPDLLVGIIQTTVKKEAWKDGPPMHTNEARRTMLEIQRAVDWLMAENPRPQIILLPELAVPIPYLNYLNEVCGSSGTVLIVGLDYWLDHDRREARNIARVCVPETWPTCRPAKRVSTFDVGKTYPAPTEDLKLRAAKWMFSYDPNLWIFDSGPFGRFGVCICYDLLDVERAVLYRGQVHHLFVLAYNQDTTSFSHIAESVCRTVFCNVVVCNTGCYGGSVALTPYYESYRRPTYRLEGQNLAGVQTVKLPVAALGEAWKGAAQTAKDPNRLKSLPPRYKKLIGLKITRQSL